MPRKNDYSDLTCYLDANPIMDRDQVYFSDEGWAYRHYKSYAKSNDAGGFWDECIVAGEALLANGQPDTSAEEFGSTGAKNFLFGDGYQGDAPLEIAASGGANWVGSNVYEVGQTVEARTAVYTGGVNPVTYRYRFQTKAEGTNTWVSEPWTTTTNAKNPVYYTITAAVGELKLQSQALDSSAPAVQLISPTAAQTVTNP